ncbi:MAG: hypothetical protein ABWX73_12045 [Marmoricola sp.]
MATRRVRPRVVVGVTVALLLVVGLLGAGWVTWQRLDRSALEEAMGVVPASSARVGFTDWDVVRSRLDADLGDTPDREAVEAMIEKAYDRDYAAVSSVDEAAGALQEIFGFGPATAQWEAFAQGSKGAVMVLKVREGSDFGVLADNLRSAGYGKPKEADGVWEGGADLVSGLDPTITPELQYVVLLEGQGLVVTSDNPDFVVTAAEVAAGDAKSFSSVAGVEDVAGRLGDPANAMVWGRDFACTDLAMSQADEDAQQQAETRVQEAGGVTPLAGLAMSMAPNRTLQVVAHFEDSERAEKNLRPRAELAVGEAIGRGVSFSDDFELTSSKATGSDVVLTLEPRTDSGFVLSALYDGPVLFATC